MRVYRGLPNSPQGAASRRPCALTIGNFDGVHRGHQALLAAVRNAADRLDLEPTVMTFEPHPREFFAAQPGSKLVAPARIANLRDKLGALALHGIERVIVKHFNARLANLSAEAFIKEVLVEGCNVRWIMVGEDFCFGARRAGNFAMLKEAGKRYGFEVESLATVNDTSGERISSSAIRTALADGDLDRADHLLGHPYFISGHVIHGQKLGRTIGFPTANIRVAHKRPALSGIFVVQVHGVTERPLPAVASIGVRPTVDESGRVLLEVHLFDFAESLYGKLVRIEFMKKLRDEEKYDDLSTLQEAIAKDAREARAWFKLANEAPLTATDRIC